MATDTHLVDDVIDRVLHVLIGKAGPEEELDRECRWDLHAAQLELCNEVNPHAFRAEFEITTEEDVAEYDLPDDFHAILEDTVRFQATDFRTLREIPVQMFHRYQLSANETTGDPELYHILHKSRANGAWRIFFSPTPETNTRIIVGAYRSLPDAVWNSTRGSGQTLDIRFPAEFVPLLVSGTIACGHFSRYLNAIDLGYHSAKWEKGIASFKKNNNPVIGKAYQRQPFPGRRMSLPGGIYPAFDGGQVTAAAP